ncbi:MAG: class II aldolase/adducin family protein [Gammaproteobacteria bacterium]|nr:class II aldolase/adducin family protein [Gammaproteobacteria bacterium]
MSAPQEGVTKFELRFTPAAPLEFAPLRALNAWRTLLHRLGLIGRDPARYGGVGFGNVSQRLPGTPGDFAISGTQTGDLAVLGAEHYALIEKCDIVRNSVEARGPIAPSSESLTHAMLYRLNADIHYVFHGHSPQIWRHARALGIPVTSPDVAYGTPAMAAEIERLYRAGILFAQGIVAMGGHDDGVVAFGARAEDAGLALVGALAAALARDA